MVSILYKLVYQNFVVWKHVQYFFEFKPPSFIKTTVDYYAGGNSFTRKVLALSTQQLHYAVCEENQFYT